MKRQIGKMPQSYLGLCKKGVIGLVAFPIGFCVVEFTF